MIQEWWGKTGTRSWLMSGTLIKCWRGIQIMWTTIVTWLIGKSLRAPHLRLCLLQMETRMISGPNCSLLFKETTTNIATLPIPSIFKPTVGNPPTKTCLHETTLPTLRSTIIPTQETIKSHLNLFSKTPKSIRRPKSQLKIIMRWYKTWKKSFPNKKSRTKPSKPNKNSTLLKYTKKKIK